MGRAGRLRLSIAKRAITRGNVLTPIASAFDRLIVALCVALMLFFAATAPARAADQIQHSPAFIASHAHGGLGSLTFDAVHDSQDEHADHHGGAPGDEDAPGDHLGGGHHHHGDHGPNLLAPQGVMAGVMAPLSSLHGIGKDRRIAGLRPLGPERPPRTLSLTA